LILLSGIRSVVSCACPIEGASMPTLKANANHRPAVLRLMFELRVRNLGLFHISTSSTDVHSQASRRARANLHLTPGGR
jgi:hypothetical protein